MKKSVFLGIILLLKTTIIISGFSVIVTSDSITYFYPFRILEGNPHPFRMVLYPEFVNLFVNINKDKSGYYIVIFQHLMSLMSIFYFYKIMKEIIKSNIIIYISTLFYVCYSNINIYNNYILPESFCIIIINAFIYYLIKSEKNTKNRYVINLLLIAFVGLMLKPIFLYVFLLSTIYAILKTIRNKINTAPVLFTLLLLWLTTYSFVKLNEQKNGYFGLTTITVNNSLANIINSGSYTSSNDNEILKVINESVNKNENVYVTVFMLNAQTSPRTYLNQLPLYTISVANQCVASIGKGFKIERLNGFIKQCVWTKTYVKYIISRLIRFILTYKKMMLLSFVLLVLSIYKYFKKRKIPIITCFLILLFMGNMFSIVIGGIEDWERLLLPSLPIIIITYSIFIDNVLDFYGENKLKVISQKIIFHFYNKIS